MAYRIIIADDHPIVRSGIRAELSRHADLEVVGEATNGDDVLPLVESLSPDIVLLDVNMPGKRTIDILTELQQAGGKCKVLILTAYGDTATILGVLRSGAVGYVLKDEDPFSIPEAIRTVIGGGIWISETISQQLNGFDNQGVPGKTEILTNRERQVLSLVAAGKTNREIALLLCTTDRTVEFHIGNILQKFDVKKRIEAVLLAREKGII
jgi:DNA-binding NarL/FixJ family response regulator